MRERLTRELNDAVRQKEKRRISTLRLINAAIKDRDIAARTSGRERISDEEILQVLAKMIKQREESAKIYEDAGRLELAAEENEEIEIISAFLPAQLDDHAIHDICAGLVKELDAHGMRDMGRCMAALKERYPGQMDFAKASAIIKELLK
ncbi:MAG: GatB/YqeY domain-containing protein [Hyphomicrobiales bacterium]|nr:GatB/YqeY domain-containing protein [Hyphomicrobiales bacterium]